jgi:DNA-binding NarL/FixJ family response regulator
VVEYNDEMLDVARIAIVDDHLMIRELVLRLCLQEPQVEVVASAGTGGSAVSEIRRTKPDLVVLDIELPDFDGFRVLSDLRDCGIRPLVIILSSHKSPYTVYRVEHAQVQGFVDKQGQTGNDLRSAIRAVRNKGNYFSPGFVEARARKHMDPFAFDKLLTTAVQLRA